MKVSGIEAQQLAVSDRITQIKLVRADDVALRANAKQFALDRVEIQPRIDRLRKHLVQRPPQQLPWALAIDGKILIAVGNPDIRDAGRAELPAKRFANLAAGDSMRHPEPTNPFVTMSQRKPTVGLRMRKERRIEIEPHPVGLGPLDPRRKMLRQKFVALDLPPAVVGIDRMQIQPVLAGN